MTTNKTTNATSKHFRVKKLVNLTPHSIKIVYDDGHEIEIPPCGAVVRAESKPQTKIGRMCGQLDDDSLAIEVWSPQKFDTAIKWPDNLPKTTDAVIVSMVVGEKVRAAAESGMTVPYLVLSPDSGPTAIREEGQIVAVRRLVLYAEPTTKSSSKKRRTTPEPDSD